MRPEENKELIRHWIGFADAGFSGPFEDFIAADYVGHLPGSKMRRAELERLERVFVAGFPGSTYSIEDLVAEGDRVVLRVITRGVHRGPP